MPDDSRLTTDGSDLLVARLIGRIVHDFNNPLAAIVGFADLLRNPMLSAEKQERYVKRIYEQSVRLSQLVETMSFYSSLPEPVLVPIDLGRTVRDLCSLREAGIEAIGWELENCDPNGLLVVGDKSIVVRILQSLLNNSEQAYKESGQDDRRTLIRCGREANLGFLEVLDSGPGIPQGDEEKIFDPFYTTRRSGGLGLGLTVARSLAVRLEGSLRLVRSENQEYSGAHFRLSLPFSE